MKIIFLGTAHGIPEKDRRCSSTLLEIGENLYVVDMGLMTIEEIRKRELDVASLKGVFITHMHGDHINGLPSLADLLCWYFTSADPVILLPSEKGCEAVRSWLDALDTHPRPLRLSAYRPGVIFDDGVLRVTAFKTGHTATSHAFLCEAEGKRILFTGDLTNSAEDFPKELFGTHLDLAVCESAHVHPETYLPIWANLSVDRVVLQHVQPRKEKEASDLAERQRAHPCVTVGFDGMELTL